MTESIKLVKLDFMIIKQYWKEIVMSGLMLTIILGSTMPLVLNVVLFLVANTLLSYPFIVQEKDKMDKFYSIIAVSKVDILKSKYLSTLVYMMMIVIFLIPLNLFIKYGIKEEVTTETILLWASIGVLLYGFVAAIQIPCYFKWGYTKSKMITVIFPVAIGFGTPIVVIGGSKLLGEDVFKNLLGDIGSFLNTHHSAIILGCLTVGIICFTISYYISKRIYISSKQ